MKGWWMKGWWIEGVVDEGVVDEGVVDGKLFFKMNHHLLHQQTSFPLHYRLLA